MVLALHLQHGFAESTATSTSRPENKQQPSKSVKLKDLVWNLNGEQAYKYKHYNHTLNLWNSKCLAYFYMKNEQH